MGVENFTTYTEVDPNSRVTVTATRVTATAITANEDAYVYKDAGVAHFAGNFEHWLETLIDDVNPAATGQTWGYWGLSNNLDDFKGLYDGDFELLVLLSAVTSVGVYRWYLREVDSGGNLYQDVWTAANEAAYEDTLLYWKVIRDESVGTYGTLYAYMYSDAARTVLVDTLQVALHEKMDFRYVFGGWSYDANDNDTITAYAQNLDLKEQSVVPLCDHHYRTRRAS